MTGQDFEVDTEAVIGSVHHLRQTVAEFDEIATYAGESDPDPWMWGLQGLLLSQQYELSAERVRAILGMMRPAFDGILDRIESCCDDYAASDGDAAQDFGSLDEGFNGGATDV